MNDDEESVIDLKPVQSNKEDLLKICKLQGFDSVMLNKLLTYGFTEAQLQTECSVQAANFIANKLMEKVLKNQPFEQRHPHQLEEICQLLKWTVSCWSGFQFG